MTRKISLAASHARKSRKPRPRNSTDFSGKLTEQQKEYVVHRLAAYDSPTVVQKRLWEEFGVNISRTSVQFYDPTKRASRRQHERWTSLFHDTRAALRQGSADIGASHVLVRIRWRELLALREMERDNSQLANAIIDSIAKDVGDCFGAKHKHEAYAEAPPFRRPTITITGYPDPANGGLPTGKRIIPMRFPGDPLD